MVSDYNDVPCLEDDAIFLKTEYAFETIVMASPRDLRNPKTDVFGEMDSVIFDALNLTQTERDAVYEAVINLVEARLKKADSL